MELDDDSSPYPGGTNRLRLVLNEDSGFLLPTRGFVFIPKRLFPPTCLSGVTDLSGIESIPES